MKSSTETLIKALEVLAQEIQSPDGVANAAISEAADRLQELSNDVLAKRVAELDRKCSEQAKVIEHIAKAVGCESDPFSCWESVDSMAAQVEQLRSGVFHFNRTHGDMNPLLKAVAATPSQCLAEVKAAAVLPIFNKLKAAHGDTTHPRAKVYLCVEAYELAADVMQNAKAGE